MSANGRRRIPRPPTQGKIIGYIKRAEAGAIIIDMAADVDIHEFAAIMEGLTTVAKGRGFSPGEISRAHAEVMMSQRGIRPATPSE